MTNVNTQKIIEKILKPDYLLAIFLIFHTTIAFSATTVVPASSEVELYNTFTLKISRSDITTNKFFEFPKIVFTKGSKSFVVEGFFDGDENGDSTGNIWKARFMPDEIGQWEYSWDFNGDQGTGTFNTIAQTNALVHGHVKRTGRFLKTDNGKGFIYKGSNWPDTRRYRVNEADFSNTFISTQDWVNYINRLSETNHNGTTMVSLDRLINNDRASFDLAWTKKIDFAIEVAANNGIYVVMGLLSTWGRGASDPYVTVESSSGQILNPWNNTLMAEKEFYLRYMAARFSGYYNIIWEIGNEMERYPNNGSNFTTLANTYYLPWLRGYDPYDIPITISEGIYKDINVDIGGLHQGENIGINESLPIIHTELVSISGATGTLWGGKACRNSNNRKYYRRTIWKGMVQGGSGSIECSLPFSGPDPFTSMDSFLANANVRNVMEDHGRFSVFLSSLINEVYELIPLVSSNFGTANVQYAVRGKAGEEYIAYFYGDVGTGVELSVNLPAGNYTMQWMSPASGQYSTPEALVNNGSISSPWANEYDAALRIYSATASPIEAPGKVKNFQLTIIRK